MPLLRRWAARRGPHGADLCTLPGFSGLSSCWLDIAPSRARGTFHATQARGRCSEQLWPETTSFDPWGRPCPAASCPVGVTQARCWAGALWSCTLLGADHERLLEGRESGAGFGGEVVLAALSRPWALDLATRLALDHWCVDAVSRPQTPGRPRIIIPSVASILS